MPRVGPTTPLVAKEETRRLRSYLPALVLERLTTAHGPETPGTEHRFGAAALFADISGFTSMSEALAATGKGGSEEMTELLNDYFGTMVALVDAYGGSVTTFGGDALTAVFPYRGHSVRAIRRAVRCANDMQLEMGRYQMIPTSAGPFSLAFKAGLAAGPVLLTTIGDERLRFEPVIAGTSIDGCVAAEHHASPGTIVLHPSIAATIAGVHASPLEGGFAAVEPFLGRRRPTSGSSIGSLDARAVDASTVRAYMHPSVAVAIESGHGRYLNEHRRVTAVFTAFDGPDPTRRAAGAELQRVLSPALDAVTETGGHLLQVDTGDKGDTFIVLFGAPVAHGDDERRALTFALRLREVLPDARIGVCCGAMFCGEVGGDSRRTYTTIGDPMNVAARLMQRANRGVTLVAGSSEEAVHGTVRVTPVDALTVKGRSQPVRPLSIAGPTPRSGDTPPAGEIVGRRSERERLRRRIDGAVRGRGRTVVITGPAGIGKSRLVEDAIATAVQHGLAVHRDWCRSTTTATPYASIRGLVGSLLGLEEGSVPDERRVRNAVAGIDAGLGPRSPLLGPVLGIAISDTDVTRGITGDLRRELLDALMLDIVAHRAERGPLMLCVEDCHWLDPSSGHLVSALSEGLSGMAILLLLTARAVSEADPRGQVPTPPTMPHAETIPLPPLDDRDSLRLARATVRRAFGTVPHSKSYLDWLVERADGNPFFLEETVHLLRDRDIDPGEPTAG
nr:AAA family ATPase [Actinomycetota bacterium]